MKWFTLKEVFILHWLYTVINSCSDLYTKNKRLDGFNFRDLSGSSLYSCAAECASYPVCRSFNFLKSGRICQLNYVNNITAPEDFLDDEDSWYGLAGDWKHMSPCSRAGCSPREKCSVLRTGQTLCETFLVNVAVSKTALASSAWHTSPPPNVAVDGNKNRSFQIGRSCFATANSADEPWWQVDLHGNYMVFKVAITTRADCCVTIKRLHDFSVEVSHADPANNPDVEVKQCVMYDGAVSQTDPEVTVTCDVPVIGRFLRISGKKRIHIADVLQMCEVEVFAI